MRGTDSPKSFREISAVLAGLRLLQRAFERGETTAVQEILQEVDPVYGTGNELGLQHANHGVPTPRSVRVLAPP